MWVYFQSEALPRLWTVGFYDPEGEWNPDSDWDEREDAATRAAWLNGSTIPLHKMTMDLDEALKALEARGRK